MNIFLIADDVCQGIGPIVGVVHGLFDIIKILIPIALLIMGVIDLAKAVLASDDKEIKAAQKQLVKRAIAAAAVFFAVTLVNVIMGLVGKGEESSDGTTSASWADCWNNY